MLSFKTCCGVSLCCGVFYSVEFQQCLLLACRPAWPTLPVCFIVGGFSTDSSTAAKMPNKGGKHARKEKFQTYVSALILSAPETKIYGWVKFFGLS